MRALGLAHHWQRLLDEQRAASVAEIATAEGMDVTQVRRVMRLTLLAPEVVERLVGAPDIVLEKVMRRPWPNARRSVIGTCSESCLAYCATKLSNAATASRTQSCGGAAAFKRSRIAFTVTSSNSIKSFRVPHSEQYPKRPKMSLNSSQAEHLNLCC
jgi:hypothetical protein